MTSPTSNETNVGKTTIFLESISETLTLDILDEAHKTGVRKVEKQQQEGLTEAQRLELEGEEQRQENINNISGIFVDSMPHGVPSAFLTSVTREDTSL